MIALSPFLVLKNYDTSVMGLVGRDFSNQLSFELKPQDNRHIVQLTLGHNDEDQIQPNGALFILKSLYVEFAAIAVDPLYR
jgi:hypothetical protein